MDPRTLRVTRFVVEAVRDQDGELDWWTIDQRVEATEGLEKDPPVILLLRLLLVHGLLRVTPHRLQNNARYWITDEGRAFLTSAAA